MPALDVTEYTDLATARNGAAVMAGSEPSRVTQQVSVTGGSLASAAFSDATKFVRVHSDIACRIAFGQAPVASGASQRLAAGATEYFGVQSGIKIAVISTT